MDIEKNKIYQKDCLEVLSNIATESIDLILTDPPYNISRNRKFTREGIKDRDHNFGDWDNMEDKDYYEFLAKVWKESRRILKPYGQLLTFGPRNWEYEKVIDDYFTIKRALVWHKPNPTPQFMKISYLTSYEKIIWAVKNNDHLTKFTFNFERQNEMHDFFEAPITAGKERFEHPTQKPLSLIRKLIRIHSDKGDMVLDPFMGSGTTAVACQLLSRDFIGAELEDEYFDIMKQRLGLLKSRRILVRD